MMGSSYAQSNLPACPSSGYFHNCFGTFTFASGNKYVGEFKDGKWNGQGTFTYSNGAKYVGEWKDSNWNGQGTLTYASGKKYVGEFKDDKTNGQGILYLANGSILQSGVWNEFGLVTAQYVDPNSFLRIEAAKEAEEKRIQETKAKAAEEKLMQEAKAAEERRIWLTTPAGKKFTAEEEAKAKKQEAERLRMIAVEEAKAKKAQEERLKDEARMKKQEDERLRVLNAENRKNPNYQDTSKMRQAFRTYGIANLRLNCHQDETINEQTGQKTVNVRFQKEGGIEIAVDNGRGLMKIGSNSFELTHDRSVRIGLDADRYYIKVYPNTFFRYMELAVSDNGIDLWQQAINYHFIGSCKYK